MPDLATAEAPMPQLNSPLPCNDLGTLAGRGQETESSYLHQFKTGESGITAVQQHPGGAALDRDAAIGHTAALAEQGMVPRP